MKYLCVLLGFLTGKTKVKCDECSHLEPGNRCYGHQMPDDVVHKTISCGFWSRKTA